MSWKTQRIRTEQIRRKQRAAGYGVHKMNERIVKKEKLRNLGGGVVEELVTLERTTETGEKVTRTVVMEADYS